MNIYKTLFSTQDNYFKPPTNASSNVSTEAKYKAMKEQPKLNEKNSQIQSGEPQKTGEMGKPSQDIKTEKQGLIKIADICAKFVGKVFINITVVPAVIVTKSIVALLENAFKPSLLQKMKIIDEVKIMTEVAKHSFSSYGLEGEDFIPIHVIDSKFDTSRAASSKPDPNRMDIAKVTTENGSIGNESVYAPGIGKVNNCYFWKTAPTDKFSTEPSEIQNPTVRLPKGLSATKFNDIRRIAQEGVMSRKGIDENQAKDIGLDLGGVTIEATLPYKAGTLLKDNGADVKIHCIFQTGLNFKGDGGGGIPVGFTSGSKIKGDYKTETKVTPEEIKEFIQKNSNAAIESASKNGSDVLVYNIGIGTGEFAGANAAAIKKENIDGLCEAAIQALKNGSKMQIIVPNIGFNKDEIQKLKEAGIQIIKADKGAVAALCARKGLKVSETFAGDPMSMLGIHGQGFWWETAGSASDEERAAFLTPCYGIAHNPINIYEAGKRTPTRIAALSEFMVKQAAEEKSVKEPILATETVNIEQDEAILSNSITQITTFIGKYETTEEELADAIENDDPTSTEIESNLTAMARHIKDATIQNENNFKNALSKNPELKSKFDSMQERIEEHLRKIDYPT